MTEWDSAPGALTPTLPFAIRLSFSGQQEQAGRGPCGMTHFLGPCAGLQEKQLALARCSQNEFIRSLRSSILDPS